MLRLVLYIATFFGLWFFDISPGELKLGWVAIIGVIKYFDGLYKRIRDSKDKKSKDNS